ncbi:glycosyltransferase family 4 protein [Rhodococcus sp. CX]|uniref:glycosyltransferase family 4 protein n=1 Tax=Rhodococcus sp. CX TaxID=2789880 RepID=UPI0018CDD974|nr:glycosyltransferase family 4 protein [Rhodococcus sp. CX]MBH0122282.1 glycosyltransferase family 4 protein [Rhodococcus sp. CX]
MTRVLVVTRDRIGEKMAGPAIRAWEISKALSEEHDVRLVAFGGCSRAGEGFQAVGIGPNDLEGEVGRSDVVLIQGYFMNDFPWLRDCPQVIVVDLYDPFHLESLEVERFKPREQRVAAIDSARYELQKQLERGDMFLCASEKQRDLWIGHLAGVGRVNPDTYDMDQSLRELIAVVPFGTSPEKPARTGPGVKQRVPGIAADDKVVIWGGGLYNWFDPIIVVRAIERVSWKVPEVRMFFLGMKHPNPDIPESEISLKTRSVADELGLTGKHVFFNEDWVPYESRSNYLLDAEIGISTHFDHVETAFSFRTRILDYLWAGLPMISTEGDTFSALIARDGLGIVVPPEDVEALSDALIALLTDDSERGRIRERVEQVAQQYTWPVVLAPLLDFCRDPRRAPDAYRMQTTPDPVKTSILSDSFRSSLSNAWRYLRDGELRTIALKIRKRLGQSRNDQP